MQYKKAQANDATAMLMMSRFITIDRVNIFFSEVITSFKHRLKSLAPAIRQVTNKFEKNDSLSHFARTVERLDVDEIGDYIIFAARNRLRMLSCRVMSPLYAAAKRGRIPVRVIGDRLRSECW